MTQSTRLSNRSAGCRLEWRPSRWLIAALAGLGPCAGLSVLASDLPANLAWPCALLATATGAWLAWRESRRPRRQLLIRPELPGAWRPAPAPAECALSGPQPDHGSPRQPGANASTVDGIPVQGLVLQWRGPLAFLGWRDADGRMQRLSWWPDTLPADLRRELRLAAPAGVASRRSRSMAP